MMFIQRQYSRTEHDDYVLHVESHLTENKESVDQRVDNQLVGWIIQDQFE